MKFFNVLKRYGLAAVATVTASIGTASAALPADVSSALGDAATDAGIVGGAALVAIIAAAAFKYARRAL